MGITNHQGDDAPDRGDDAPDEEGLSGDSVLHGESTGAGRTTGGRATRPPKGATGAQTPPIPSGRSAFSTKWAIDRLDEQEKRFSFAAAGLAAVFGVAIYFSETRNPHFRLAKGQLSPQTTLIIGILAAVLLFAATKLGRRAPVGFVGLFTGAALGGTSLLLGLPFFALAVWVLYRSYKIQKQTVGAMRAAGNTPRPRASTASSSTSARSPSPSRPSAGSARRTPRSKGPVGPTGNKRYTPKRPPPPKPKPSRRERKAPASD